MASPIMLKLLIHIHLKSWQLVPSSNNETCKWVMFLWNIKYWCEKCYFLKWGYFYSDFVCARWTRHFEMKWPVRSLQSLGLFIELNFFMTEFYFLNKHKTYNASVYKFASVYPAQESMWIFLTILEGWIK